MWRQAEHSSPYAYRCSCSGTRKLQQLNLVCRHVSPRLANSVCVTKSNEESVVFETKRARRRTSSCVGNTYLGSQYVVSSTTLICPRIAARHGISSILLLHLNLSGVGQQVTCIRVSDTGNRFSHM